MIQFSVVIAVYNKETYLSETLASVLAQSYSNFELIIVNDGSTDGSEAVIKSFLHDTRIKYYPQDNQGAGAARNAGIQQATNPYIALLDADDLWEPNYLAIQKSLIETYPEQFVFATAQTILEKGKKYGKKYAVALKPRETAVLNFFDASRQHAIIHSSSVVIHKDVFTKAGFFDASIMSGQDTDLWIRIGLEYNVVFCNISCVIYRLLPGSLFRSTTSINQKLNPDNYNVQASTRLDLKKYLDLNRFSLAIQAKLWGETDDFKRLVNGLNPEHLNGKQRLLLQLPKPLLKASLKVKSALDSIGFRVSPYS